MCGKIVAGGRASIRDWPVGVKTYFFRVFGIVLVFAGIFFVFVIIGSVAFIIYLLSQIMTPDGMIRQPTAIASVVGSIIWPLMLLASLAVAVFFVSLAPAILDDKGVVTSVGMGLRMVRRGGVVFAGYAILILAVSAVTTLLNNFPRAIELTQQSRLGTITVTSIASQLLGVVIGPLWILTAFHIYRVYSTRQT